MNIQACIIEFENLGYTLYLDGGNLRYRCTALIEPPKDMVIPLLDTLKRNKGAVIECLKPKNNPIPFDTLKALYLEAFNRTGWQMGLMARPEVNEAEDRLNEVWLKTMEGKASLSLEEFKQALREWEGAISGTMTREAVNG